MSNATKTAPATSTAPSAPASTPSTAPVASEAKSTFTNATEAQKLADAKNAAPLKEGQEKRVPFKVYECKVTHVPDAKKPDNKIEKVVFAVAQNPAYALNAASDDLGVSITPVGGDSILPPEEYLKRLTPEQLEAARKFLGGK